MLTERALHTAERILDTINEAIREQESRSRLKTLSQDLWIGQGYVSLTAGVDIRAYRQILQAAGSDGADPALRWPEIAKRRVSQQSQKRAQVARVLMQ